MSFETFRLLEVSPNVKVTCTSDEAEVPLLMAMESNVVLVIPPIPLKPSSALPDVFPPITVPTIRCRWIV